MANKRKPKSPNYTPDGDPDEMILAAIIAGGARSGREVSPSTWSRRLSSGPSAPGGHGNGFGIEIGDDTDGPCCAVGAGVLYAGIARRRLVNCAVASFARVYRVPHHYAVGVSDGFEYGRESACAPDEDEYHRGVSVGAAAYDFFCGDD